MSESTGENVIDTMEIETVEPELRQAIDDLLVTDWYTPNELRSLLIEMVARSAVRHGWALDADDQWFKMRQDVQA